MSTNLSEFCETIISKQLGDLAACIFTTLSAGRLTANALAEHAQIPLRRVRATLSTLLEEQLIFHHTSEDGAPTFYSVNWRNAYNLARHTNIIRLVTHRYGDGAGQIVKNILQLGHARVGDLAEAYQLDCGSKRDSGVDTTADHVTEDGMMNGIAKPVGSGPSLDHHITSVSDFHLTLRTLLRSGILVKVGTRAFVPPPDLQEQIEEAVISERFPDRKVTGPKKAKEFAQAVSGLKRKWRADDAFSELHDYSSKGTIKRPGDVFNAPNKRIKVNGHVPNGHVVAADSEQSAPKLSNDLVVSVDFAQCTLALRSQRLEQLAKRVLGPAAGAVYGALLQSVEGQVRPERADVANDDEDDDSEKFLPRATVKAIAEKLDPQVDLGSTIKGVSTTKHLPNGVGKKKGKRIDGEFADIGIKREHSDSEDEHMTNGFTSYRKNNKRMEAIEAHLHLLQEHPRQFCKRKGNTQEWFVDFPALTNHLIEAELDATVNARYGKIALRIVRMLRERGKLEEKQVASFAMMRIKDIRGILTELQFQGLVEAQELPKDNQRQPSRTTYLWYFDTQRVQNLLLQQAYKAMARTLQRIPVEREKYRTVIEKAERTDVKGHEEVKLVSGERQSLRAWREIEERLLTQVERMDEVVAVLRDFNGADTELTT